MTREFQLSSNPSSTSAERQHSWEQVADFAVQDAFTSRNRNQRDGIDVIFDNFGIFSKADIDRLSNGTYYLFLIV